MNGIKHETRIVGITNFKSDAKAEKTVKNSPLKKSATEIQTNLIKISKEKEKIRSDDLSRGVS